ncbi:hypothetical protein [Caldibacillus debilis]|uniref:hypothetical protein n=1 Tax=Caldibacillus debilis TaxID=301148 RepID=UPI0011C3C9F6|nr:hypothetical protein [Caldibacillus debilis]
MAGALTFVFTLFACSQSDPEIDDPQKREEERFEVNNWFLDQLQKEEYKRQGAVTYLHHVSQTSPENVKEKRKEHRRCTLEIILSSFIPQNMPHRTSN